jgi:hypothetical protein
MWASGDEVLRIAAAPFADEAGQEHVTQPNLQLTGG